MRKSLVALLSALFFIQSPVVSGEPLHKRKLAFLNASSSPGSLAASSLRKINFGTKDLGKFFIGTSSDEFMAQWPEFATRHPALGSVSVPRNAFVSLETGWSSTDCLQNLAKLRGDDIQSLDLNGSIVTHDSFKYVCKLKGLKSLILEGTDCDNGDLELVCKRLPSLEGLCVGYTRITSKSAASIAKLKSLHELSFHKAKVTAEVLPPLAALQKLSILDLRDTNLGDESLLYISRMKALQTLNLSRTKLTDAQLSKLLSLPRLKRLDLSGNRVSDHAIKNVISKMTALEELNLSQTEVTNVGVGALKSLRNLKKLWLRDLYQVNDGSVATLSAHKALTDLEIQKTNISEKAVQSLANALPSAEIHSKSLCKCRKRTRVN